ncbi:MAG: TGS domain-containing protein, partial [Balneolales bacterium]
MSEKEITLTLPDGSKKIFTKGVTGREVAESISSGLARNALSVALDDEILDVNLPLPHSGNIKINTWETDGGKKTFWHSSAHLLAEAVEFLYPGAKFGIGPAIENGFYYDIDFGDTVIHPEDLETIEKKMIELARRKSSYVRTEVSKEEAVDYYKKKDDPYKLDLLQELEDGTITFYQQGDFVDLCRGPHIPSTGFIKAVKLLKLAGSYW